MTSREVIQVGNFSEVIVATHMVTKEVFPLKVLEKKHAADLAIRQQCYFFQALLDPMVQPHPRIMAKYRALWNCTMSIPICSPVSNIKIGIRTVTVMKDDSGLHAVLEAQIATWFIDDG
jgi:hypothetical protein